MSNKQAILLMVLCLLVAGALRLSQLGELSPGLHYDEAANGILAADIGLRGDRPIFISSYTGKETLFFYVAGGLMRLMGDTSFTLRIASAFFGLLTVATTYWLGLEIFRDRRVAILAAILIATSFWHLLLSRIGFRAISQPLLQGLTVACLFHGLRLRSVRWVVLAGIFLGLTGYTYLAARIFPILLALALLPLGVRSQLARVRWRKLLIFGGVGILVLLPLLIYFQANPNSFWVRIEQVGPGGSSLAPVLESYWRSLRMFFLSGDPYWRFNIPELPLFNWFWGALLLVGWLYLMTRWFRQQTDWERSAALLLVLAPLLMLLPTALATTEIVPSNLRAIGLIPFIFYLPATGAVFILDLLWRLVLRLKERFFLGDRRFVRYLEKLPTSAVIIAVVILILALQSISVADAYFDKWSSRTDVFYDTDSDLVAVSDYLDELELSDETLFLAATHYRHPTVAFLSKQYDLIKWLPESEALVFPSDGKALYIYPHNSPLPDWASRYLPTEPYQVGPDGPDGKPLYNIYQRTSPAELIPKNITTANFNDQVTLLGYDFMGGKAGASIPVTLFWRVEQEPIADIQPFVHLEDPWGHRWSQVERSAYPAEQWDVGDVVVQQLDIAIPEGAPAGSYHMRIGFFDPETLEQLPLIDAGGRYAGNALVQSDVPVNAGTIPDPLPEPPISLNQMATNGLELLGYERFEQEVRVGAPFGLSLWWLATEPLPPLFSRLELIGPNNVGWIISTTYPVYDTYPFDAWSTPQFVIDQRRPTVPDEIPNGTYSVILRMLNGADDTLMLADLGTLTIQASDRNFIPPKVQYPLAATFGEDIAMLGYNFDKTNTSQYLLSLVWKALDSPNASYTVFVHVLDRDGTCCLWQEDQAPKLGTYPTDQWVEGEIIVDEFLIELPQELATGQYPIEVGLYLPDSGQRLLVKMTGIQDNDALLLRPIEIE